MDKKFVDLDNARLADQRQVMQQIIEAGHCPFCWENLQQYHKQPIIKEGQYWRLTPNQWPYEHTQLHLLAILKDHKESLRELTREEGAELVELMAWAETEYEVPGGGFAVRFGDTNYSAGTVTHLHAQFLVPDIHHPEYHTAPVRVKIGKYDKNKK